VLLACHDIRGFLSRLQNSDDLAVLLACHDMYWKKQKSITKSHWENKGNQTEEKT